MMSVKLAQQALEQAQIMQQAAEQNDWQKVEEVKAAHFSTVNQLVVADISESEAAEVRELLVTTQQLNQVTEQLAIEYKNTLVKNKQTLIKANKMQQALDAMNSPAKKP